MVVCSVSCSPKLSLCNQFLGPILREEADVYLLSIIHPHPHPHLSNRPLSHTHAHTHSYVLLLTWNREEDRTPCAGQEKFNAPGGGWWLQNNPNSGDYQGIGLDAFPFSQPNTQSRLWYVFHQLHLNNCKRKQMFFFKEKADSVLSEGAFCEPENWHDHLVEVLQGHFYYGGCSGGPVGGESPTSESSYLL